MTIIYQSGPVWVTQEKFGTYMVWRQTRGSTHGAHCGTFDDRQSPTWALEMARNHAARMAARIQEEGK